jgi:hypothetical protein
MPQIQGLLEKALSKDIVSASKQMVNPIALLSNPNNKVVIITEYLPEQEENRVAT